MDGATVELVVVCVRVLGFIGKNLRANEMTRHDTLSGAEYTSRLSTTHDRPTSYPGDCEHSFHSQSLRKPSHRSILASMSCQEASTPRTVLVLFCGLPAAGKSTLARNLLRDGPSRLRTGLGVPSVRVWHLSFDAILAVLNKRTVGSEDAAFSPERWHEARALVLSAVRAFAMGGPDRIDLRETVPSVTYADSDETSAPRDGVNVLLLDDNMQYRSMRRAYYQVAREARCGLCTICLPIDVDTAVERDAKRVGGEHVGKSTISLMAAALQWPEPERHPWESGSGVITLKGDLPDATPGTDGCRFDDGFWRALVAASSRHIPAEAMGGAEADARKAASAASVAETAASALHQLDLRLRQLISQHMASAEVAALDPSQRGALAKRLSQRKQATLKACRKLSEPPPPSPPQQATSSPSMARSSAAIGMETAARVRAEITILSGRAVRFCLREEPPRGHDSSRMCDTAQHPILSASSPTLMRSSRVVDLHEACDMAEQEFLVMLSER